jgi:hypothetical protein
MHVSRKLCDQAAILKNCIIVFFQVDNMSVVDCAFIFLECFWCSELEMVRVSWVPGHSRVDPQSRRRGDKYSRVVLV